MSLETLSDKTDRLNTLLQEEIDKINDKMRQKSLCLEFKLDTADTIPQKKKYISWNDSDTVFCLFDTQTNESMSFIRFSLDINKYTGNYLTIDSYTPSKFERKRYNLLCRAALLICLERFVNQEQISIQSLPSNIISIYSLLKYFDFIFKDGTPLPELSGVKLKNRNSDSWETDESSLLDEYTYKLLISQSSSFSKASQIFDLLINNDDPDNRQKIETVCSAFASTSVHQAETEHSEKLLQELLPAGGRKNKTRKHYRSKSKKRRSKKRTIRRKPKS